MFAEDLLEVSSQCVAFLSPKDVRILEEGVEDVSGMRLADSGLHVASVDGAHLRSYADLLRAVGEAFSFPDYYGQNYNALNDCLRDFSWLPAPGYVLRIRNAEDLWRRAPDAAGGLIESWLFCAAHWAAMSPPLPFYLLFEWRAEPPATPPTGRTTEPAALDR
jgi:hypothetical protein